MGARIPVRAGRLGSLASAWYLLPLYSPSAHSLLAFCLASAGLPLALSWTSARLLLVCCLSFARLSLWFCSTPAQLLLTSGLASACFLLALCLPFARLLPGVFLASAWCLLDFCLPSALLRGPFLRLFTTIIALAFAPVLISVSVRLSASARSLLTLFPFPFCFHSAISALPLTGLIFSYIYGFQSRLGVKTTSTRYCIALLSDVRLRGSFVEIVCNMIEGASRKRSWEEAENVTSRTCSSATVPAAESNFQQDIFCEASCLDTGFTSTKGVEGWKDYLIKENLITAKVLEKGARPLAFTSSKLGVIYRDLKKQLPGYRIYIVKNFILSKAIRTSTKAQPPESKIAGFEELNEPTLKVLEDDNIVVMDDSGTETQLGEILFVKAGRTGNSPMISHRLSTSVTEGIFCYLSSEPKCKEDFVRHKSLGREGYKKKVEVKEEMESNLYIRTGGPPPGSPQGISHVIHGRSAARNDPKIKNIQLYRGPRTTWEGRGRIGPLHQFLYVLKPLSRLLGAIFHAVAPEEWARYNQVLQSLPTADLTEEISKCFGIWSSRVLVLNSFTDIHVDLLDVCHGFCAITAFGDFGGGNVCLLSLRISILLKVGSAGFLRSYIIPHYIGKWDDNRFSVVHFTHQSVFDYYSQEHASEKENMLWPIHLMPQWYSLRKL